MACLICNFFYCELDLIFILIIELLLNLRYAVLTYRARSSLPLLKSYLCLTQENSILWVCSQSPVNCSCTIGIPNLPDNQSEHVVSIPRCSERRNIVNM